LRSNKLIADTDRNVTFADLDALKTLAHYQPPGTGANSRAMARHRAYQVFGRGKFS